MLPLLQPAEGEREILSVYFTKGVANVSAGAEDLVLCLCYFRRAEGVEEVRKMLIYLFRKNSAEPSRTKKQWVQSRRLCMLFCPFREQMCPEKCDLANGSACPRLGRWNWAWLD